MAEREAVDALLDVTGVTAAQQRAVDDANVRYHQEKREAIEKYVTETRVEVLRRVLRRADAVPFLESGIFGTDEPEGRRIPDALERVGDAFTGFMRRALGLHELANAMNNEGEEDDPYNPIYWDRVRLQRAGTHQAAVDLLAEVFALAFACDQYGKAKHAWTSPREG